MAWQRPVGLVEVKEELVEARGRGWPAGGLSDCFSYLDQSCSGCLTHGSRPWGHVKSPRADAQSRLTGRAGQRSWPFGMRWRCRSPRSGSRSVPHGSSDRPNPWATQPGTPVPPSTGFFHFPKQVSGSQLMLHPAGT